MSKFIDLTGQKFGRLTVIERAKNYKSGQSRWLCKCNCGNEKVIGATNLRRGYTKSCGCLSKETMSTLKRKNIIGKKNGRLTVLEETNKRTKDNIIICKCKCDCGNIVEARKDTLLNGMKNSCGCLDKETSVQTFNEYIKPNLVENTYLLALTRRKAKNNTSGFKGVSFRKDMNKWQAKITFKGVIYSLGCFHTLEEAAQARKEAEEKYFQPILEKYGGKE